MIKIPTQCIDLKIHFMYVIYFPEIVFVKFLRQICLVIAQYINLSPRFLLSNSHTPVICHSLTFIPFHFITQECGVKHVLSWLYAQVLTTISEDKALFLQTDNSWRPDQILKP